jgi:hypothetical protein
MHGAGIVIGLAIRSGCQLDINLSDTLWSALTSSSSPTCDGLSSDSVLQACNGAFRHGLVSIIPEVCVIKYLYFQCDHYIFTEYSVYNFTTEFPGYSARERVTGVAVWCCKLNCMDAKK